MENLNRVTYKNSRGMVATCKAGEEMTQYLINNFEIVTIEYAEVEKEVVVEVEIKEELNKIEVGKTYKVGNRVRTVSFVGKTERFFDGEHDVVVYNVKDGSERYERMTMFERWLSKA